MLSPHEQVAANTQGIVKKKGVKTTQICDVLEIGPDAVRKRLRGFTPFTFDEIGILADYLDVPFSAFIEGAKGWAKGENS